MRHITLHYPRIQYENFIGDERWIAMNHVQTRAMTEEFFTHYFDPLLYDIFSTVDRGQGICQHYWTTFICGWRRKRRN